MNQNQQNQQTERIVKRLDLMLHLMLKANQKDKPEKTAVKDQILELYEFGFSTPDICSILNKNVNIVNVYLTTLRKEGKIISQKKNQQNIMETPVQVNSEA